MKEDIDFIMKVLASCSDTFHFSCIDEMIKLFSVKHPTSESELINLQKERQIKFNAVLNKLT